MSISGFGKHIACEPYLVEEDHTKGTTQVGKMQYKLVSQRVTLIGLKVIYGNDADHIIPGDIVYVPQAAANQVGMTSQWTKAIELDIGDGTTKSVVMVPLDSIQLVDRRRAQPPAEARRPPPAPTPTPAPGEPRTP